MLHITYLPNGAEQEYGNPVIYISISSKTDILYLKDLFNKLVLNLNKIQLKDDSEHIKLIGIDSFQMSAVKGSNKLLRRINDSTFEIELDPTYWRLLIEKLEILAKEGEYRGTVYLDDLADNISFHEDATIIVCYEKLPSFLDK